MKFCSEVFACVLVMVINKKSGIIGHLFRLKTDTVVFLVVMHFGDFHLLRKAWWVEGKSRELELY